jgi:predicted GNAT family acetyltransferase
MIGKYRTFVPDMETKIETTNTGGKVLAYDGEELVGRLDFSFKGNVLSIDHTHAYKEGIGVGSLLVSAVNDYAVSKGLKVLPVCSFAVVWYQRHPQFAGYSSSCSSLAPLSTSSCDVFTELHTSSYPLSIGSNFHMRSVDGLR